MPVFRFVAVGIAKLLSKVFGLATMSFFGRMPSREDDKLALVGILSLAWLPVVVAMFVPAFAHVIIPFAPDDDGTTRWIAVALAVVIPIVVGVTVAMMRNNHGRGWRHILVQLGMGLPYTAIIGVTMTLVVTVVPIVKIAYVTRRFEVMRLLVMVPADAYQDTLDHMVQQLEAHGIEVDVSRPPRVIGTLFRLLGWVLGRIFVRDVADEMRVIRPKDQDVERDAWFEVTLHAADMTIIGPQEIVSQLHAILVDAMDERVLYLTWDDASQRLEDRIRDGRERMDAGEQIDRSETGALVDDLAELALGQEEWNAVRRLIYRLERDTETRRADHALAPQEPSAESGVVPVPS
jgi:hypothetical protein